MSSFNSSPSSLIVSSSKVDDSIIDKPFDVQCSKLQITVYGKDDNKLQHICLDSFNKQVEKMAADSAPDKL